MDERLELHEHKHRETCPYCHATLGGGEEAWPCDRCGTRLHAECFRENELRCTVLGCEGKAHRLAGVTNASEAPEAGWLFAARKRIRDRWQRDRAREERRRQHRGDAERGRPRHVRRFLRVLDEGRWRPRPPWPVELFAGIAGLLPLSLRYFGWSLPRPLPLFIGIGLFSLVWFGWEVLVRIKEFMGRGDESAAGSPLDDVRSEEGRRELHEHSRGGTCPLCQRPIRDVDEAWPCQICGTRYHAGCWSYNHLRCAVLGCGGPPRVLRETP